MPKVFPSQVMQFLEQSYGPVVRQSSAQIGVLDSGNASTFLAIINLIDQMPQELVTLDAIDYNAFIACYGTLKYWSDNWIARGAVGGVESVRGYQKHILPLLWECLSKCKDEAASEDVVSMNFIQDLEFKNQLRVDISSCFEAERNGEWKAATVVGGSVCEALLLYSLNNIEVDVITECFEKTFPDKKHQSKKPDEWYLNQYAKVALNLKIISQSTYSQVELVKDFRNLIHPGRSSRLGEKCNRGTALAALAAIELVVGDLDLSTVT